jgi:hypothetical protein
MNPITPTITPKKQEILTGNKGYHFPCSNVAGYFSAINSLSAHLASLIRCWPQLLFLFFCRKRQQRLSKNGRGLWKVSNSRIL